MAVQECADAPARPERVLVVDDEREIADLVATYLAAAGFETATFYDGPSAWECIQAERVDLAIIDVMLPGMSGFDLCERARRDHLFPIIMLTAKVEDIDKIMGLTIGADDYITKPFNPLELMARVKTQLRRYTRYNQADAANQKPTEAERDIRGLVINRETHKCTLYGKAVQLTPIEFSILWYLCENQGKVVSSEELFEAVWGEKFLDNNNTVMAHIGRLREKLGEPPRKPRFIKTIWGVGYQVE